MQWVIILSYSVKLPAARGIVTDFLDFKDTDNNFTIKSHLFYFYCIKHVYISHNKIFNIAQNDQFKCF